MADIDTLPRYDISNEAWRQYEYANGGVYRVEGATTLIVEKRKGDHDRHRLIGYTSGDGEWGMYVAPGWCAIRWQAKDGSHGITF